MPIRLDSDQDYTVGYIRNENQHCIEFSIPCEVEHGDIGHNPGAPQLACRSDNSSPARALKMTRWNLCRTCLPALENKFTITKSNRTEISNDFPGWMM
jgi:hypothetical protein